MFYTYILYSKSTDTFYKGSTQDIKERIRRHNNKMEKATQSGAPWILLWSVEKQTKGQAQILEYKLKNLSRSRTCDFILKYNEGIGALTSVRLRQRGSNSKSPALYLMNPPETYSPFETN